MPPLKPKNHQGCAVHLHRTDRQVGYLTLSFRPQFKRQECRIDRALARLLVVILEKLVGVLCKPSTHECFLHEDSATCPHTNPKCKHTTFARNLSQHWNSLCGHRPQLPCLLTLSLQYKKWAAPRRMHDAPFLYQFFIQRGVSCEARLQANLAESWSVVLQLSTTNQCKTDMYKHDHSRLEALGRTATQRWSHKQALDCLRISWYGQHAWLCAPYCHQPLSSLFSSLLYLAHSSSACLR